MLSREVCSRSLVQLIETVSFPGGGLASFRSGVPMAGPVGR